MPIISNTQKKIKTFFKINNTYYSLSLNTLLI